MAASATSRGRPPTSWRWEDSGTVLASPEIPGFGNDPWWLVILKAIFVFVFLVVMTLFAIWWERRVVARMQQRIGPNRVGPFGLLQSLADGIKLALKEDIIPKASDRAVFILAPIISATPAFMAFAVIPFGPEVSIAGHETPLQLTDLPVGVRVGGKAPRRVSADRRRGRVDHSFAHANRFAAAPLIGGVDSQQGQTR